MNTEMSMTMGTDRTICDNFMNMLQDKNNSGLAAIENDITLKKFPSLAALHQMGVKNFKPSIRHKIANTCKNFNICNEPNLDNVTPRVGIYSGPQASAR